MNVEFKTHQLVVAGMQTQIKLLTTRCIEWQQKLAEANQRAASLNEGLDKACATLAAVQIVAEGGKLPEAVSETILPVAGSKVLQRVQDLVGAVEVLRATNDDIYARAASEAEQHALEIKEMKARARKRARNRSRR